MAKTSYPEPALKHEGVLGKPPSYKEQEIDAHIKHAMQVMDDHVHVEEVTINLHGFYASYVNPSIPAASPAMKKSVRTAITSLVLVIRQPRRKPRVAFLRQVLLPCPYGNVKSFTPGIRAYLVPFDDDEPSLVYGEDEVRNRLGVEMEFDVTAPHREQLLKFGEEVGYLERQYCLFKNQEQEDDDV